MDSTDTPQAALDVLVLKTLARGPNHGFAITMRIQEVSDGLLRVEEGSLYPALHRLENNGLLISEWKNTPNGRRARFYRLTAAGRKRLQDAEASWQSLAKGVNKVLRFV